MPGPTITMLDPHGNPHDIPVDQVDAARMQQFTVEGDDQRAERIGQEAVDERYSTPIAKVGAVAAGFNRTMSFGVSDAIGTAIDPEQARHYRGLREANPGLSAAGEIGGALLTAIPTGGESIIGQAIARTPGAAVSRFGARIAESGGTSTLGRLATAGAGGAAEGMAYGIGSGITEVSLSKEPVDLERAISTISSHALYAGGIGGAAGSIGKLAEIGLTKARGAIDDVVARQSASQVTDDLAGMGRKQIDDVIKAEKETIKASNKVEAEAIEAARVSERKVIADDIRSLRQEIKDSEQWATTKDLNLAAKGEGRLTSNQLGRDAMDAEKTLARTLKDPISLAENPTRALSALRQNEHTLTQILNHTDDLKAAYAADGLGGKRLAALDRAPQLLEKNRALQARILEASKPITAGAETSARLEAAVAAKEALQSGANPVVSGMQRMAEGATFGAVTGAVAAIPIPGAALAAPYIGMHVSRLVGEKVFGRLAKGASEQAIRTGKAVSAFLGHAEKGTKAAIPVATKVLSSVRFAPVDAAKSNAAPSTRLVDLYHERANEVRSQTAYGPDGKPEMRPEARADLADRLKGVAALDAGLADQLETLAARRIEFLASKLPKRPELGGIPVGPDRWHPSDMEMRKWARYVAGVEDPSGIEERLGQGTVSVEDADVMRSVYPERLAEITRQIVDQMPTMRVMLPYQKRLALSIMTDTPVVAAMDPRIMSVLQESFAAETPTEGGPPGAIAKPNFGSVSAKSAPSPTPAQARGGA